MQIDIEYSLTKFKTELETRPCEHNIFIKRKIYKTNFDYDLFDFAQGDRKIRKQECSYFLDDLLGYFGHSFPTQIKFQRITNLCEILGITRQEFYHQEDDQLFVEDTRFYQIMGLCVYAQFRTGKAKHACHLTFEELAKLGSSAFYLIVDYLDSKYGDAYEKGLPLPECNIVSGRFPKLKDVPEDIFNRYPKEYQETILLVDQGKKSQEIADILGITQWMARKQARDASSFHDLVILGLRHPNKLKDIDPNTLRILSDVLNLGKPIRDSKHNKIVDIFKSRIANMSLHKKYRVIFKGTAYAFDFDGILKDFDSEYQATYLWAADEIFAQILQHFKYKNTTKILHNLRAKFGLPKGFDPLRTVTRNEFYIMLGTLILMISNQDALVKKDDLAKIGSCCFKELLSK